MPVRKLAAILHADVVGFSRLTAIDEDDTYVRLRDALALVSALITARRGRVVNTAGDAVLADFATASDALACSVAVQRSLSRRNATLPPERRLEFRIGVNLGEVLEEAGDLFGDGVNVAARLESLAEQGGICVADAVRTAVGNRLPVAFEDMGACPVRNIPEPIHAWRVVPLVEESPGEETEAVVVWAESRAYAVVMGSESAEATRAALDRARLLVVEALEGHGGRVAGSAGDAVIALFDDEAAAVASAHEARAAVAESNERLPASQRVHYRFGVDRGPVAGVGEGIAGAVVERAAELAVGAPTDGVRLADALRSQSGQAVAAHGATGRRASVAVGRVAPPPQLEGLALPPPDRPSIAILPFAAIGEDPEADAIAEGLRIEITNALMKIAGLLLIAPSTINHLRGEAADAVAERVGVRHVLEGTVRRSGGRVRVTAQLTDVANGALVWSERYDRKLDDSFALQDDIAERVVVEMDVKLTVGEQARAWRKCLTHPKARAHFYRGLQQFFQGTEEAVEDARRWFERVAELVPESPVGPTWASLCLWLQATRGWTEDPEATQSAAAEWAERAAVMEDADGQAHTVLGNVRLLQRRFDEAIAIARDSVAIRPGCNTANGILANVLLHCGEYEDAIRHAKRAIRIGPVHPPWFLEILSAAYREAGEVGLAVDVAREVLRLAPRSSAGRVMLVAALARGQWPAEASAAAREVTREDPGFSVGRFLAGQPFRSSAVPERLEEELRGAGLPP